MNKRQDPILAAISRLIAKDEKKAQRPNFAGFRSNETQGRKQAGKRPPPWEAEGITKTQWLARNQSPARRQTMRVK